MLSQIISQQNSQIKPVDIEIFNEKLNKSMLRVFYEILKMDTLYKSIYCSQAYLGKLVGRKQQTISDYCKKLQDNGLIFVHKRGSKYTCEYEVNPLVYEPAYLEKLKVYFNNFLVFSFAFLLSNTAVSQSPVQLTYSVVTLSECTVTILPKSTRPSEAILMYNPVTTWRYDLGGGVPNKKVTYEQFEALFLKKEQYSMQQFTQEQLETLAQYPTASLQYAQNMLTRDMASGKPISNLYAYFHSIAKRHAEKPSTGKTSYHGKTVSASSDRQARLLMQERYDSQIEGIREQKRAALLDKGIDPTNLSAYQIKLALEGKPYLMDDTLKEITEGPFKSVAVFQELFEKKVVHLQKQETL